jgi:hypothetical protein
MANELTEFLIQKETLEAAADSIRAYLGETSYVFIPPIVPGFLKGGITRYYYEEYDTEIGEDSNIVESETDSRFTAAGYEKNNEGLVVPVLYGTVAYQDGIVIDRYFYVGQEEVDQHTYDKWRKIEDPSLGGEGYLTWDSVGIGYVYTDIVVMTGNNAEAKINPTDFPNKIMEVYATGLSASGIKNANAEVY